MKDFKFKKAIILFLLIVGMGTSKEKLNKRFLLISLFLGLVVLMFNTSELYGYISHLHGKEKAIACVFIGISAEFSIFTVIYVGYRIAGFCFALLSFLVGMTFHNWTNPVFLYNVTDWTDFDFRPNKYFFATFLIQGGLSLIVWFLSESYVDQLKEAKIKTSLAKLQRQEANLQQSVAKLKKDEANLHFTNKEIEKVNIDLRKANANLIDKIDSLNADVRSITNRKNALSRNIPTLE